MAANARRRGRLEVAALDPNAILIDEYDNFPADRRATRSQVASATGRGRRRRRQVTPSPLPSPRRGRRVRLTSQPTPPQELPQEEQPPPQEDEQPPQEAPQEEEQPQEVAGRRGRRGRSTSRTPTQQPPQQLQEEEPPQEPPQEAQQPREVAGRGRGRGRWRGRGRPAAAQQPLTIATPPRCAARRGGRREETTSEEEEDKKEVDDVAKVASSSKSSIIIEYCKSDKIFQERAAEVQGGLKHNIDDIKVLCNPSKKVRKGCFEVRMEGGETYISLENQTSPFDELRNLDVDTLVKEIVAKMKNA